MAGTTTALDQLLARIDDEDPFYYRLEDVRALQLQAADERFQQLRQQMPVLDQRSQDTGTERISGLADMLPLFFSDATYKSYPESLVEQRNWKALGSWVEATSAGANIAQVDVEGVQDIDEWLARLRDAGQYLYVSSGTSGRVSLFHASAKDRERDLAMFRLAWRWATGAVPDQSRPVFALFPVKGSHRMMDSFGRIARDFGRPDAIYYLSDQPLRVTDVNSLGRLRKAIGAGTATPSEIDAFEQKSAEKQVEMQQSLERLADAVVRHRNEPCLFIGTWGPEYRLVKTAVDRGLASGVHPDSVILAGGGLKGIVLPPDFKEQLQQALRLDNSRYLLLYGMAELSTIMPACSQRRYHIAPWMIPIVLDKDSERILEPKDGRLTGRLGFFDLALEGRWGALISGDHGTVDLKPCPCGCPGPSILDTIVRYLDLPGGDDRVNCAGTIDAYVRGALGSAVA
ncbi:MAG: hypothetical protein JWQ90_2487 [Hydrocarboniphaga sp.]|uniref:hypothetical protein n=1 Tax=Hydrocarboniphaga sp. TaxID=2033016 RepID=UPI0026146475|nr:hypothetical protein [Hydrocarboniphaga sp.]MDB5970037.1 hypothetical protein [Hydrocarboniphaga sp.]